MIVRKLTTGRHKVRPLHPPAHIVAQTPRKASTRSPCASASSVKSAWEPNFCVQTTILNFITPFRRTGRHEVAPTASAIFFLRNVPQTKTFFDKITGFEILTFLHNSRATKKVVFFPKTAVFALKSHFFAPKPEEKFTTSDLLKTTSEVILTTSDLVLTTFELVFAHFEPKKGRNRVVSPLYYKVTTKFDEIQIC